ncbi:MAG: butyrate kinase [candidate division Zixibacteria bacterium]
MTDKINLILVINPGSTSTKVSVFRDDEQLHNENIKHDAKFLGRFNLVSEQFDFRKTEIEKWLECLPNSDKNFAAVSGRGAPLKPLEGGTYIISENMLDDVRMSRYSNHASNLGSMLADYFGRIYNVPAYITDPITVDNFTDVARISGVPGIVRKSRSHCLNIKAVGRAEATRVGKKLEDVNYVVAHLGGGISIAALEKGRIVDVNDGLLGMGPFSVDRAGALPIGGLVDLCFSGKYSRDEVVEILSKKSGLLGYLGHSDLRQVELMIEDEDKTAELIYRAMCYQIAKEIGAAVVVLKGNIDGIILTGGMAYSVMLAEIISEYIKFIAPIIIVPGEKEMQALAEAAIRVISGEEQPKTYD